MTDGIEAQTRARSLIAKLLDLISFQLLDSRDQRPSEAIGARGDRGTWVRIEARPLAKICKGFLASLDSEDVPAVNVASANATLFEILKTCMPSESSSALRRLIQYGGVRLNGEENLDDPNQRHAVTSGNVLRVGKRRWFRAFLGQS